jgi:hypothetical protein
MRRVLFSLQFFLICCYSSPTGAPPTQAVCESMTPSHGASAQESESPYHLEVSSFSVKSGEILKISITADEGRSFKGFLLMALTNDPENPSVGVFEADEDETTPFNFRDCFGKTHNAVTHSSRDLKSKISFKWKVNDNFAGFIQFKYALITQGEQLIIFR